MKRGLYDIKLEPNTFREMAFVFHEVHTAKTRHMETVLQGFDMESPKEAIEKLRVNLLPGEGNRREDEMKKKAEYIRSLQDVDWSEVFEVGESQTPDDPLERYK